MSFRIPRDIYTYLIKQAQSTPDREVCGLLASFGDDVVSVYPVNNLADEPAENFFMDPTEQIAALKAMRRGNEQLCGIYHSHPRSEAIPSEKDLAQAAYPGTAYLIISLINTKPEIKVYYFDGDSFSSMALEVFDTQ